MEDSKESVLYDQLFSLFDQHDRNGVAEFLRKHPFLASSPFSGWQPIHCAARADWEDVVKLLSELGADVDCRNEDGETPLCLASESCPNATRALLKLGADPNLFDNRGWTPLVLAIFKQSPEAAQIGEMLLEAGAEYDLTAGTAKGDLKRVDAILCQDPKSVSKVPSQQTLLDVLLGVGVYGTHEDRFRILELLLNNGLTLPKAKFLEAAKFCDSAGYGDSANLLRKHADTVE